MSGRIPTKSGRTVRISEALKAGKNLVREHGAPGSSAEEEILQEAFLEGIRVVQEEDWPDREGVPSPSLSETSDDSVLVTEPIGEAHSWLAVSSGDSPQLPPATPPAADVTPEPLLPAPALHTEASTSGPAPEPLDDIELADLQTETPTLRPL